MSARCPLRRARSATVDRAFSPRRLTRWLVLVAVLAPSLACQQLTNPAASAELQESLYELQELLGQMRDETAMLQWQVDSLQGVVARQDTSLRRLANQLGMPLP
jgi:hypothetical protein